MSPYPTYGSLLSVRWRVLALRSCNFELVIKFYAFVRQFAPPLPFLLAQAMVSIQVGKYLHWVFQCDGAWWWLPLSGLPWIPACPAPSPSSSIGDEFNWQLRIHVQDWPSNCVLQCKIKDCRFKPSHNENPVITNYLWFSPQLSISIHGQQEALTSSLRKILQEPVAGTTLVQYNWRFLCSDNLWRITWHWETWRM